MLLCPSRNRRHSDGHLTGNFQTGYDYTHYSYNNHLCWGPWPHPGNGDTKSVIAFDYFGLYVNPGGMRIDACPAPTEIFILAHNGYIDGNGEFTGGGGFGVWSSGWDGAPDGSSIAGYPHGEFTTPLLFVDGHADVLRAVLPPAWIQTDPGHPWYWPD